MKKLRHLRGQECKQLRLIVRITEEKQPILREIGLSSKFPLGSLPPLLWCCALQAFRKIGGHLSF